MTRFLARTGVLAALLLAFPSTPSEAAYKVSVTRKQSNLYAIDGTSFYVATSMCLNLAIMDTAYLDVTTVGGTSKGTMYITKSYGDPDTCRIVGTYAKSDVDYGTKALDDYGTVVTISAVLVPTPLE